MQLKRHAARPSPIRHRAEIDAKARDLISEHGDGAYSVARGLSRVLRPLGEPRDATWSRVARRIVTLAGSDHRTRS